MAESAATRAVGALVETASESRVVPGILTGMALSRDGGWLVAGSRRGSVRCWQLDARSVGERGLLARIWKGLSRTPAVELRAHAAPVTALTAATIGAGSTFVISGAADGSVTVADPLGRTVVATETTDGPSIAALDAVVAGDDLAVATAQGETIQMYAVGQGSPLRRTTEYRHSTEVTCLTLQVIRDRTVAVFGDDHGRLLAWLVADGSAAVPVERFAGGEVAAIAAVPIDDGLMVAAGDARGTILSGRIDWVDSALVMRTSTRKLAHHGAVRALAVGDVPDRGPLVLSVGDDRVIRSWPLTGGWPSFASDVGDVRYLAISHGERPLVAFNLDHAQVRPMPVERFLAEALPNVERPETWAVSDAPIQDDAQDDLDFAAYADALAFMIDHPGTSTPLSIAIDAPWGAGKTSLANLISARLAPEGETVSATNQEGVVHIACWFNAWMHDDEGSLASALATAVVRAVAPHRSRWRRMFQPVPVSLLGTGARVFRFVVLLALLGAGLAGGALLAARADFETWERLGVASAAGLVPLAPTVLAALGKAGGAVRRYVRNPGAVARQGSVVDARDQLGKLIHQATRRGNLPRHRRLVLFIDDLERCEPPRALEVCQVVNQLVGHTDVVTVLLVDMETIAASAEVKYRDVAEKLFPLTSGRGYGQNFLEKVVQFHFSLPRHTVEVEALEQTMAPDRPAVSSAVRAGLARRVIDGLRRAVSAPLRLPLAWVKAAWQRRRQGAAGDRFWKNPWQRLRSWVRLDRLLGLGVYVAITAVAVAVYLAMGRDDTMVSALTGVAALLAAFVWRGYRTEIRDALRRFARWLRLSLSARARYDHQQDVIARALRSVPADSAGSASLAGLTEQVQSRLGSERVNEKLLSWEVRRRAVDDSAIRQAAEREAARWLPAVPRKAKRVANNLAVLLAIMYERRLLDGEAKVSPAQLGKWVAFSERYPSVARAVHKSPELLGEMTAAASLEDGAVELRRVLVDSLSIVPPDVPKMAELLASKPRLDGVVEQLTQHRPPKVDREPVLHG